MINSNDINDLHTLRDFIRWSTSCILEAKLHMGHGYQDAWDEAVAIVLHSLHLPHDMDPRVLDARLTHSEKQTVLENLKRRVEQNSPVAYITQQAWFCGLPFYVDERVLIPRSPIAELIEQAFSPWVNADNVNRVLDLCTGSACIAIACAYAFPDAQVDAIDVSADALEVAALNVSQHELTDQVTLIDSNLFNGLAEQKYDIIVSNPPYVSQPEMDALPAEYRHEPALGLAAGEDGLQLVDEILAQASQYLTEQGVLIVEVGNSQEALIAKYPDLAFFWFEFERGGHGVFMLTKEQLSVRK